MSDIEDDVPNLIEFLADACCMSENTRAAKDQLRDALVKLIDERVRMANPSRTYWECPECGMWSWPDTMKCAACAFERKPMRGDPIIYHLADGDILPGSYVRHIPDVGDELLVRFTPAMEAKYDGRDGWFGHGFIAKCDMLVPECCNRGTGEGEWEPANRKEG